MLDKTRHISMIIWLQRRLSYSLYCIYMYKFKALLKPLRLFDLVNDAEGFSTGIRLRWRRRCIVFVEHIHYFLSRISVASHGAVTDIVNTLFVRVSDTDVHSGSVVDVKETIRCWSWRHWGWHGDGPSFSLELLCSGSCFTACWKKLKRNEQLQPQCGVL